MVTIDKEGLSNATQKELLFDIKARGGLETVTKERLLEDICNSNTDLYGPPNLKLRKSVSNRIDYLKNNPTSYEKLQRQLLGTVFDYYASSPIKPTELSKTFGRLSISSRANTMSQYFGNTPPTGVDVHIVDPLAWKNRGILIWKSKEVSVGQNPTISTDVYSIMIESIDPRFFTVDSFTPFKATQISEHDILIEYPAASYDFLFGEYGDPDDDDTMSGNAQVQEELDKVESKLEEGKGLVVSCNRNEQKAFLIQQNKFTTTDEGKESDYESYLTRLLLRFNEPLNYGLIYPDSKKGEIDYRFVAGESPYSCSVKWRIAVNKVKPQVVKKVKPNKNKHQDKFKRFVSAHGEMFWHKQY